MFISRRFLGSFVLVASIALLATPLVAQRRQLPKSAPSAHDPTAAGARKLTQAQANNLEERIATTMRLVNRFEPEARALGRSSAWRQATIDALLTLSLAELRQVEQGANSADGLPAAISAANADPNLLGDPSSDLVYTPITPCRFSDTRVIGGKINGFRGYDMENNGAVYGGTASCHPPTIFGVANADEIPAAAINVTLIDTTIAPGFVAIKPNQAAPISSLVNWYEVGQFVQSANLTIATMEQDLANPDEFVIQTPAPVHVILDFFGVFLPPQATGLEQTFPTSSVDIANGQFGFTITPACPAGYSMTGGQCGSTVEKPELTDSKIQSGGWYCGGRNTGGGTLTLTATAICSRVPGR
jgi:hypothetical protein